MANQITHIRKPNRNSSHEHITHVKGINSNNSIFEETVSTVIQNLKRGESYFVKVGGDKIDVTHQKSPSGNEYIKTKPDQTLKDNLLSLPEF